MAEASLRVPLAEANAEQLLRAIYRQNVRMEKRMSELTAAVTELQGAVDGVAQRLLPQIDALEEANATLRTQLEGALADDEAAAAAFAEAEQAVTGIRTAVQELNTLGASPDTPVEDVPAEDTAPAIPVEVPTEEPQPVGGGGTGGGAGDGSGTGAGDGTGDQDATTPDGTEPGDTAPGSEPTPTA